jgi:hypothetical protein
MRRGAALYVAVTATTAIVSVLALASLSVVRIERREAVTINNRLIARTHARSAVELALKAINNNASWRTAYTNGVETAGLSLGTNSVGTVSWSVSDTDGSLTNLDTTLRIKGVGRVGNIVQVGSLQVRAGETTGTLRNYELLLDLGHSLDDVKNDRWWGQYFKPTLPSNANGWHVTSAQIRIRRDNGNRTFRVRLYRTGVNGAVLESIDFNSNSVPNVLSWFTVTFSGSTWLQVGESACLAVETTSSSAPIEISYKSSGVSAADSGLVRGNPSWYDFDSDEALQYRIEGGYTTSDNVSAVAGTWEWDGP